MKFSSIKMKSADAFFDEHDKDAKHASYKDSFEISKGQKLTTSLALNKKKLDATLGYQLDLPSSNFSATYDLSGSKTKFKGSALLATSKIDVSLQVRNACCKMMWAGNELAVGILLKPDGIEPIWCLQRRFGLSKLKLSVKYSRHGVTWVFGLSRNQAKLSVPFCSSFEGGSLWLSLCLFAGYYLMRQKRPSSVKTLSTPPPVLGSLVIVQARYGSYINVISSNPDYLEVSNVLQRLVAQDRLALGPISKKSWLGNAGKSPWLMVHYRLRGQEYGLLIEDTDFLVIQ